VEPNTAQSILKRRPLPQSGSREICVLGHRASCARHFALLGVRKFGNQGTICRPRRVLRHSSSGGAEPFLRSYFGSHKKSPTGFTWTSLPIFARKIRRLRWPSVYGGVARTPRSGTCAFIPHGLPWERRGRLVICGPGLGRSEITIRKSRGALSAEDSSSRYFLPGEKYCNVLWPLRKIPRTVLRNLPECSLSPIVEKLSLVKVGGSGPRVRDCRKLDFTIRKTMAHARPRKKR